MTRPEQGSLELASSLERMNDFIGAFRAFRWRERQARLSRMSDFISVFQEQERKWRESRLAQFNVFSMLKVGTDEVTHSAFLAWLLDPEGGHKQGSLFLKAFLEACRPELDLEIPDEYHVQTEYAGIVSIVDIVVYRADRLLLYIENKTISPDTPDQTDREFSDMQRLAARLNVPPACQAAVYLTPQGRRPAGAHAQEWRTAAYHDVGEAFDRALPLVTEDRVRFLVDDWLETIQTFGGTWRQRMTTQLSEESIFIAQNWDNVMDIMRAKTKLESELSQVLLSVEAELRKLTWWNQGWRFDPYPKDAAEIYIANQNWRIGDDRILWLGVYHFDSEHIFGPGPSPQLYTRVWEKHAGLQQLLAEEIRKNGESLEPGYYFVGRALAKCLVDEPAVREYPDLVRRQVVDFLDHYATLLMQCDGSIMEYIQAVEAG